MEANKENYLKLKSNIVLLPLHVLNKIELINKRIGQDKSDNNIYNIFIKEDISLINMDLEGSEIPVLMGATGLISRSTPVLAIAAYHKYDDLYSIPKLIHSINKNYKFFLRKYIGYSPNAFNEFIIYCVPEFRTIC